MPHSTLTTLALSIMPQAVPDVTQLESQLFVAMIDVNGEIGSHWHLA